MPARNLKVATAASPAGNGLAFFSPAEMMRAMLKHLLSPKCFIPLFVLGAAVTLPAADAPAAKKGVGYSNTPIIPGTKWHVHDGDRPVPPVVTSGATFSHLAPPPSDAVVLFDGKDLSKWSGPKGEAGWKICNEQQSRKRSAHADIKKGAQILMGEPRAAAQSNSTLGNYMEVAPKSGSIQTKDTFADFQLHLEFATPAEVKGDSQHRGNSGVIFNGIYEVQVLDSYQNPTYPDGQCAALYGQSPPLVNASKKPGEWQSYDIVFESPRWDARGKIAKKAAVTVIQNGVVVHHRKEYQGNTPHQKNGNYDKPHAPEVFILLQDHNNPMRFRNIWLRKLRNYDQP